MSRPARGDPWALLRLIFRAIPSLPWVEIWVTMVLLTLLHLS